MLDRIKILTASGCDPGGGDDGDQQNWQAQPQDLV
jgi:hypothetical protein